VTLDEAAPRILRSVCEHLEYGLGVFWLVDRVAGVLRCAEAFDCTGFDIDANSTAILGQSFGFGEGLPGRVWAGHVAASMTNPSSPHEIAETSMAEQSAIAFPIRNGAEFLGVMEFVSRDRRDEDHGIVRTMAAIGRQVNQFIMRCDRTALLKGTHSMQHSKLLIVAMAEQCESMIQLGQTPDGELPAALRARHLLMMCKLIKQHVEDWPDTKLHRWIGFVQAGMMANRMLDLAGAKAMFDDAKRAYGNPDDDPDLIDHLDPGSSFEMELGGQG